MTYISKKSAIHAVTGFGIALVRGIPDYPGLERCSPTPGLYVVPAAAGATVDWQSC